MRPGGSVADPDRVSIVRSRNRIGSRSPCTVKITFAQAERVSACVIVGHPNAALFVTPHTGWKPNLWFKRGTIFRHALDVLRTAE
jgi:hypothetical protein